MDRRAPVPSRRILPTGGTLPSDAWRTRHRIVVSLLWIHVPLLLTFAAARGLPLWHGAVEVVPIIACAVAARYPRLSRRVRAALASVGLLTCSAVLVHLWGGVIEAHFHFFVAVSLLSLYEDWLPWGASFAYVLLHHGVMGVLDPESVYGHAGAARQPWLWAGIHAGFILGLTAVNVASWRSNELARRAAHGAASRFRSAFDDAPRGMALVDDAGVVLEVNAALAQATGYSVEELAGRSLEELCPIVPGTDERRLHRGDGSVGWALWQESRLGDGRGRIVHVVDISIRKEAEAALSWQAHHDALTGLPNRVQFVERVERALDRRSQSQEDHVAVLFVDIDDFKVVNDSLGHDAGDRLLEAVAQRLGHVLRPQDVVARFGGDEFTVLLAGVADEEHALRIADRVAASLRPAITIDGQARFVSASVGLAIAGGDEAADADGLLQDADAAMYRAKQRGKARCEVFDASMRAHALERLELEGALREALDREQLFLVYQPQVRLPGGEITGAEALLRWRHPDNGVVSPATFIPIAERTGLIVSIGAWVLREACREAAGWDDRDLHLAVNVSARQLGEEFATIVDEVLAETGLAPDRLVLEVTETALLADVGAAHETLAQLKALGVRLAVDDFGVGHASLRHLRELLPVDILKIDKSFVDGIVDDAGDMAIVEAVVRLAAALGLETVAEGVEDERQAAALSALGCPAAQGFHFARPLEPERFAALIAARTA